MNYREAVEELEKLGIMPLGMPELAPMQRALEKAGLARGIDPKRNIIVAGTNGKGSTSATLSRLLVAADQRVGLYTSPHLVTTRERFRVGDEDISEEEFCVAYLALKDVIQEESLTHFEALTLIAAYIFFSGKTCAPVDWAIWEVGMGGLYDATNAIPHHFCAITKLGLDHTAVLGNTLKEIAFQKFGVIGKNAVVIHAPMEPELSVLRAEVSSRTHCRWIAAKVVVPVKFNAEFDMNRVATPWGKARLSLCGARAAENTGIALTLFETLGFEPARFLHSLSEVRWPGRFSEFGSGRFPCPAYVSGDHNDSGVDSLLQILDGLSWETLHLVVGIGKDKNAELMLEKLSTLPRLKLYLTETSFKPLTLEDYPARFKDLAVVQNKNFSPLLAHLGQEAAAGDKVVVTGSLYLVGDVLKEYRF
jgi:dihydrofolate synthase / folylpolyglutamate synthase